MKSPTRSIPAALTFSLALAACSEPVSTAAKPCPCASGYVCCESGVCAADQNSCGVATAALSSEAQGRWTGYVENYSQNLVSDALDMTFDVDAAGQLQGRIVIGDAPPPPPPTDPEATWPPAANGGIERAGTNFAGVMPVAGATYTAFDIKWQSRRLRFRVRTAEPFDAWCAIQKPYERVPGFFGICPIDTTEASDGISKFTCTAGPEGARREVSCDWYQLCTLAETCACTAAGCSGPSQPYATISFDVALRGDEGDGTMLATGGTRNASIRLVRASR